MTKKPRVREPKAPPARNSEKRARSEDRPILPPRLKPEPRYTPSAQAPLPETKEGGNFATRAVRDAVEALAQNPDKSVFPLALILLVVGFLAIQNRIDKNDPKLALAPTFADPDLEFRPPPGDD